MLFKKKNPGEDPANAMDDSQNVEIQETVGTQVLTTGSPMVGDAIPEWSIGSVMTQKEVVEDIPPSESETVDVDTSAAAPVSAMPSHEMAIDEFSLDDLPLDSNGSSNELPLDSVPLDSSSVSLDSGSSSGELSLDSVSLDSGSSSGELSLDSVSLDSGSSSGELSLDSDSVSLDSVSLDSGSSSSELSLDSVSLDSGSSSGELSLDSISLDSGSSSGELSLDSDSVSLDSDSISLDSVSLDSSSSSGELSLDSGSISLDSVSLDSGSSSGELSLEAEEPGITEEKDAQLDLLLERLDISENIRRMNETAQEDIADVIERDESVEELLLAKPAGEISDNDLTLGPVEQGLIEEITQESMPEETETISEELLPEESLEVDEPAPLPKYVKPDFDMEPISQPLVDTNDGSISEYDTVPTVSDLEEKWSMDSMFKPKSTSQNGQVEVMVDYEQNLKKNEEGESGFAFSLEDVEKAAKEDTAASVPEEQQTAEPDLDNANGVYTEEVYKKTGAGKRLYHKIILS